MAANRGTWQRLLRLREQQELGARAELRQSEADLQNETAAYQSHDGARVYGDRAAMAADLAFAAERRTVSANAMLALAARVEAHLAAWQQKKRQARQIELICERKRQEAKVQADKKSEREMADWQQVRHVAGEDESP